MFFGVETPEGRPYRLSAESGTDVYERGFIPVSPFKVTTFAER